MALVLSDPIIRGFAFYSTASVAKMFGLPILTIFRRFSRGVFANPEDFPQLATSGKPILDDEMVERSRRNPQNDLENILPFILVGGFYVLTKPDERTALWHFRIFFFSRVLHTMSYQAGVQPWRVLTFLAGLAPTVSMMIHIIKASY